MTIRQFLEHLSRAGAASFDAAEAVDPLAELGLYLDTDLADCAGIVEPPDAAESEVKTFTVIGVYGDAEGEDGKPQRFAESVGAVSSDDAERFMTREHPGLVVAGVVRGRVRLADL